MSTLDQRTQRLFGTPRRDLVTDLRMALENARTLAGFAADQERDRGNRHAAKYCHSLFSDRGALADVIADLEEAMTDDNPPPRALSEPVFDTYQQRNDEKRKAL